jgi:Predicted hydrolases or acyltransferases (alpha/beta hydrolase superfamily)
MNDLICLHGALGSADQFAPLLAQRNARQVSHALNLPGHGGKQTGQPFSMSLFADDVLGYMDKNSIGQADFLGYSMGGYVALWLAWKHPERVGKVITYGTKLDWAPPVAEGMVRMFDAEKIAAKAPALATSLAFVHGADNWQELCRKTADFLLTLGNGAGLPPQSFSEIRCPVIIGWGDGDNVVTREESERAAQAIPNGHFELLACGKHLLEQTPTELLLEYIERNTAP